MRQLGKEEPPDREHLLVQLKIAKIEHQHGLKMISALNKGGTPMSRNLDHQDGAPRF
jgi:hypothetical protein